MTLLTPGAQVTLRSAPRTVHVVAAPTHIEGAVRTFCGRYGLPYPPTISAWRHCTKCRQAMREHNQEGQ